MSHTAPPLDHRRFSIDAQLGRYGHICCVRPHAMELHSLANTLNDLELELLYESLCCTSPNQVPNDFPTPPNTPTPGGDGSDCVMRFLTYACSPAGQAAIRAFIAQCDDYLRLNLSMDTDKIVVTLGRAAAQAIVDSCGDPTRFRAGATIFCTWFRQASAWMRGRVNLTPEQTRALTLLFANPIITTYLVDCCR